MTEIADTVTDEPIDLRRDNIKDAEAQVDASVYTLAAVFGPVAFPPNMPEAIRDAVMKRAEEARQASGNFARDSERKPGKDSDDERTTVIDQWTQAIQQQNAMKAEWLATTHSYAGQTLSGQEWQDMRDWFDNEKNVAAWEDALMAETGQSREEVRQTGGKMKRFYDLMDKDARGTLNKTEQAEFDRLNDDKDLRRGVEVQREIQGLNADRNAGPSVRNDANSNGYIQSRAVSYASTFTDEPSLPTHSKLPELTSVYREAAAGKPDGDISPGPLASPGLSPARVVQISPDNMFG